MLIFQHKQPSPSKLAGFEFKKIDATYSYSTQIMEKQLTLYVMA